MRKLFLILAVIALSPGFVFSQIFSTPPCIINAANTDTGLITPFYDSLACIEQGLAYSASVQLAMPATFNGIVALDSLVITSITGMPAGISYQQNPASGVYYADSNGCIAFAGTTSADTGAYPLTFTGYAVVTTQNSGTQTFSLAQLAQLQDAPVPVYRLNVIHQGDSCFPQPLVEGIVEKSNFSEDIKVYPNPSNGNFNLQLNNPEALTGEIIICDVTGRKVYAQSISTNGLYKTSIDVEGLSKGPYLLQVKTAEGTVSKKISVE